MENCIFCAIAKKESPATLEYEDNDIVAFYDIEPKAKVHILIVPKIHIKSIAELSEKDAPIIGKMFLVAKKLAQKKNLSEDGYRLVINVGEMAGQTVDHLHLHLMGGQILDKMC